MAKLFDVMRQIVIPLLISSEKQCRKLFFHPFWWTVFVILRPSVMVLSMLGIMSFNNFVAYAGPTPAELALNYMGTHSFLGFSLGFNRISFRHKIKSKVAKLVFIENKDLFIVLLESDGINKSRVFRFLWPNDVYHFIDKTQDLEKKLETKIKNDKTIDKDRAIVGSSIAFPIRLSYMYEFEGRKFRISTDPCFIFVKTSMLKIETDPNPDSNESTIEIGKVTPSKSWMCYLEIPLSMYVRVATTPFVDLFIYGSGGFQFTSFMPGSEQDFLYKFWSIGLMFEYPEKVNFKPFAKLYFAKNSFADPRINKDDKVALILEQYSIGLELGINFRILPTKQRCFIPRCGISSNHVHNYSEYRGKSYFNS